MANVTIYSKEWCAYCANAKRLLTARGINVEDVDITHDAAREAQLIEQTGQRTIPLIFVDDKFIGGFVELARLISKGELDHLINAA